MLKHIWKVGGGGTKNAVGLNTLIAALAASFPDDQMWNARGYSGKSYSSMRNNTLHEIDGFEKNWFVGEGVVKSTMLEAFSQNHYLVPLVTINSMGDIKETGEPNHWVLVTDMTEDNVTITNPFRNESRTYTWDIILNSMEDDANHVNYVLLDFWRSD